MSTLILVTAVIVAVCAASLWFTRRVADSAYFRKGLARSRWPWVAHIPTYALIVLVVMRTVTPLTGFPLNLDAGQFMGRNIYGIWSLALTIASLASSLSLFSVVGVPMGLWFLTQKLPHRRPGGQRRTRHERRRMTRPQVLGDPSHGHEAHPRTR